MRDQRKPVKIFAAEDDPEHVILRRDGQVRRAVHLHMDEESVERIRAGYVCIHCYEPQDEAFPEHCRIRQCRYPMRDKQARRFALEFKGTIRIGPQSTLETEEAAMAEWAEKRAQAERDPILRPSQIWLPGSK